MVGGRARGGVEDGAAGAEGVGGAVGRGVADGLADDGGGFRPLAELGRVEGLLVAEGGEDVLAVAVPVDEELDLGGVAEPADEAVEPPVLGGVGGSLAAVGLGARVGGGAARVGVPAELPVAVDVAAVAGWVGCVGRGGLSVLSPEAVGGLGVDEAWSEGLLVSLILGLGGERLGCLPSGFTNGKIQKSYLSRADVTMVSFLAYPLMSCSVMYSTT